MLFSLLEAGQCDSDFGCVGGGEADFYSNLTCRVYLVSRTEQTNKPDIDPEVNDGG